MKTKRLILVIAFLLPVLLPAQVIEGTSNSISMNFGIDQAEEMAKQRAEITESLNLLGFTKTPKYHALIIGISAYQHEGFGLTNLEMPIVYAERLVSALTAQYGFEIQNIVYLKNPTQKDILNQLERLKGIINENDNLLIFYAGHGVYDNSKGFGFWLPSDAKTNIRTAWISNQTIASYINIIKSKHTLLISDACFSGSLLRSRTSSSPQLRFYDAYKNKSRKALTSGNVSKVPDKSIFLETLLKSLEENKDAFLSASALYSKIYEPIITTSSTKPQFGIVQDAKDEGGEFVFIKKDMEN